MATLNDFVYFDDTRNKDSVGRVELREAAKEHYNQSSQEVKDFIKLFFNFEDSEL